MKVARYCKTILELNFHVETSNFDIGLLLQAPLDRGYFECTTSSQSPSSSNSAFKGGKCREHKLVENTLTGEEKERYRMK